MRYLFLLFFTGVCTIGHTQDSESSDVKYKVFVNFNGQKSFIKNDTKYFGLDFGIKAKCQYKIGFGYSWLRGTYKTEEFPVDQTQFPDALSETKTDVKFYSILFEPIIFKEKKVNISIPVHLGVADLSSEYKKGTLSYLEYFNGSPLYGAVAVDINFRVLGFMKLAVSLGYRHVLTDLEVAQESLSTPLLGLGLKIGGMCKN